MTDGFSVALPDMIRMIEGARRMLRGFASAGMFRPVFW